MLKTAIEILNIIEQHGYDACIAGGAVRDIVMDKTPNDIDLATNMPIEKLDDLFHTSNIGKSRDFGIVSILYKNNTFEIAQFRTDGNYSDNRHPDSVKTESTFFVDSKRRDFTINAMGLDSKKHVIDYHNGIRDIHNRIIRTVGNPYDRFTEDYVRMIRAARFAASMEFKIDKETRKFIRKLSKNTVHITPERIRLELLKASKSGEILRRFMYHLEDLKLLKYILPEIQTLKNLPHAFHHHPEGNVYDHTMAALNFGTDDPITNLAILLHDVGKATTIDFKNGLPTYHGHDKNGVPIVKEILQRFKFSTFEQNEILFAVENHMRFNLILEMKKSKIRKLMLSPYFDTLKAVAYADGKCRGDTFKYANEWDAKIKRLKTVKTIIKNTPLKLVSGDDVMDITGLSQGKKVGMIINEVSDWIINNNLKSRKQIVNKILEVASTIKEI